MHANTSLIKRGERRVADVQDLFATTHCKLLDTKDDLTRRIRSDARSVKIVGSDAIGTFVVPLIGRTLGRVADGLEYIQGRERTNQSLMR